MQDVKEDDGTFFKVPTECLLDLLPDEINHLFGLLKCLSPGNFDRAGESRFSAHCYPSGFKDLLQKFDSIIVAGVEQCQQQLFALSDTDVVKNFMDLNEGFAGRYAVGIRAALMAAARGAAKVKILSAEETDEMPKDMTFMVITGPIPSLIVACLFFKKILALAISTSTVVHAYCKRLGLPVVVHFKQDLIRNVVLKSFYAVCAGAKASTSSEAKEMTNVPFISLAGKAEDPLGNIMEFGQGDEFTNKYIKYYQTLNSVLGNRPYNLKPEELQPLKDGLLTFVGSETQLDTKNTVLKMVVLAVVMAEHGFVITGFSIWANHALVSHHLRTAITKATRIFPFFKGLEISGVFQRQNALSKFLKMQPFTHKLTRFVICDEVVYGDLEPGVTRRLSGAMDAQHVGIRQTNNWFQCKTLLDQVINATTQVYRLHALPNNRVYFDIISSANDEKPQVGERVDGYDLENLQPVGEDDDSVTMLGVRPTIVIGLLVPRGGPDHLQMAANRDVESISANSLHSQSFFHPHYKTLVGAQLRGNLKAT